MFESLRLEIEQIILTVDTRIIIGEELTLTETLCPDNQENGIVRGIQDQQILLFGIDFSMKLPIVIYEHGDVEMYDSLEKAEMDIEPIDVRNNEYVIYDSEGLLLIPIVVEENRKFWGGESPVECVRILPSEEKKEADLIRGLINFLSRLGHDSLILETMELEALIKLSLPYASK
jgi:hypothetical protein